MIEQKSTFDNMIKSIGEGEFNVVLNKLKSLKRKKDYDFNQTGKERTTLLWRAAQQGSQKIVTFLLEQPGINVEAVGINDTTPLYVAAQGGYVQVVESLLQKGADFNKANEEGFTPLEIAVQNGHFEVVQLLFQQGIDPNAVNNEGNSLLCIAAKWGHVQIVEFLLQKGADLDKANKKGFSPLGLAAQQYHNQVVEFLLEKGANVNTINNISNTKYSLLAITILEENFQLAERLLMENTFDVNLNGNGLTPLYSAVCTGWEEGVDKLIKRGANVNSVDNQGTSALAIAIKSRCINIAKRLLEQNDIEVTQVNIDGNTALHYAVEWNEKEIVELLLKKSNIINVINNIGQSPLKIAINKKNFTIARLLLNHGAVNNEPDALVRLQGERIKEAKEKLKNYYQNNAIQLPNTLLDEAAKEKKKQERICIIDLIKALEKQDIEAAEQIINNHKELLENKAFLAILKSCDIFTDLPESEQPNISNANTNIIKITNCL